MAGNFPKGSEWRKWDLHVHTPFSELNNGFGNDFENYFKEMVQRAQNNDIAVVGLTDYFSIEGYKAAKEILNNRLSKVIIDAGLRDYSKSILFLPNIEFRSSIIVDGNRVNYHVVFSDKVSVEDIEEHFLREIKFTKEGAPSSSGEKWSLTISNLENLGKDLKQQHKKFKSNSDLFVGMMNAVVDHELVTKILEEQPSRFKDKYLVCLPCDEDLSKCSWNGQAHLIRKVFIQKSHVLFTSNANTRDFALGKTHDSVRDYLEEFKSLKPCLHGSDAHNFDEMFRPDKDRYTWIKADPTFSGLKQTLYEPEWRVRIKSEHPDEKHGYEVIDKVRFVDKEEGGGVFPDGWIELNSGLNSIIGGKSSGKSLLLFQIAKTINPAGTAHVVKQGDRSIGYEYKYKLDFEVKWKDGIVYKQSDELDSKERPITFIPQLYLNAVAEERGEDFHEVIKDVLLDDPDYALWYKSKLREIEDKKKEIHSSTNDYMSLFHRWVEETENLKKLGDLEAIKKSLTKQNLQMEAFKKGSQLSEDDLKRYSKLEETKKTILASLKYFERQEALYSDINASVAKLLDVFSSTHIEPAESDLKTRYLSLDGASKLIGDVFSDLRGRLSNATSESLLKIGQKAPDFVAEKASKNKELAKIETKLKPFMEKFKNKEAFEKLMAAIKLEDTKIQNIKAKQNEIKAMRERLGKFSLAEKLGDLLKLYKDIEEKNKSYSDIDPENETVLISELGFDQSRFSENFSNKISKKMALAKQISDSIFDEENEFIFSKAEYVSSITKIFHGLIKGSLKRNQGISLDDAVHALLDDYFKINFDLEQHGDRLMEMSPGKRGIILFQLYLHLSNATHPILIDQPEDNLDNRTVYKELNDFIKEKKMQRQIIIVSHNANLVVSTDSEEVLVANQSGQNKGSDNAAFQFEYATGALENSFADDSAKGILNQKGIREHGCEILEGGLHAFKRRELQYASIQDDR